MKGFDNLWDRLTIGQSQRPVTVQTYGGKYSAPSAGSMERDDVIRRARTALAHERTYHWRSDDSSVGTHSHTLSATESTRRTRPERTTSARPSRRLSYPSTTTVAPPSRAEIRKSNPIIPATKYVPYSPSAFRDMQRQNGNDKVCDTEADDLMSLSKDDMSELPPIGTRPGSSKSRRSSRDSSSGGYGAKINNAMKYEKPTLLSVDSNHSLLENVSISVRPTKRSHVSPGSNGSSSSSHQGGTTQMYLVGGMSRAKSWCATEANSGPNPKLETLFERNGVISHGQGVRVQDKVNRAQNSDQVISNERNAINKPPRVRLRMDIAANGNALQNSRRSLSNSITNLSRTGDGNAMETPRFAKNATSNGMAPRNRSSLQRSHQFRSEQSLVHSSSPNNPGNATARGNRPRLSTARLQEQNSNNAANFRQAMKNVRANSALQKAREQTEPTLTPQNIRNIGNSAKSDTCDAPSDPKNDERIVQWLQSLDDADAPDDPEIEHEEELVEQPKQTDTAIHIVYDED